MASISGQPQFRYTQPPSKVIHLRNLPWECTEEELIELGKPFGEIVNTKSNVGANKNQAFIEFADLNQAIAMISYYASSAEPAQVRGKTVYLQYSNRQEIINSKTTGDVTSNVLLVTVEGVEAGDVSIDVLHLVFSAFGFVHKIATFEKTAGFQALVQFSDLEIASAAKNALDGRSIPRYLLQDHVGPCTLRITFSAHRDLNVKFQSCRSRDYTNPYLPVAPSAIDGGGQDAKKQEPESNVLLASIENLQYAVTVDVLHSVFSTCGPVQKIAIFEKNAGFQALVQYPDIQTAMIAKDALEGHCIYEGGFCKLHLTYSRHTDLNVKINNDRGRDYTLLNSANQPSILGPQPIPVLGTAPSPYNSVPYPPPANEVMVPQPTLNQMMVPAPANRMMVPQPAPANQMMVPLPGPANQMMVPRPAASWDAGAGAMATLPIQSDRQIHMLQGAIPPGMRPGMMQLPGQGSHQLPMPPIQPYHQ